MKYDNVKEFVKERYGKIAAQSSSCSRIKNSVETYVGCIGGAGLKEEYLKAIADAGFDDIEVIDAVPFDLDLVLSDPGAQAVLYDIELSVEEAKELAKTIESIRVSGMKSGS